MAPRRRVLVAGVRSVRLGVPVFLLFVDLVRPLLRILVATKAFKVVWQVAPQARQF